jgi:UDP-2,3-diacylglucosamine hydrolase
MKLTYFISDVHLGELPPEKEKKRLNIFLDFLMEISSSAQRIFFVGDLFDFWFEYKYAIPKKHFSVLRQMARLREKEIEVHYLPGNHDFFLGKFFDVELGIHTHRNEWTGTINKKNFYLYHGDGIAKKDIGYRMIKKIIRNPINLKLFSLLHPDLGIPLARFVSGSSRQYTNRINLEDHNDYIEFAQKKFKDGFDYVIMGHRHSPFIHEQEGKKYINLGDWLTNFSYGVYDGRDVKIEYLKERLS